MRAVKRPYLQLGMLAVLIFLVSCQSTLTSPVQGQPLASKDIVAISMIAINSSDSQQAVSERYSAQIVAWQPEAGFAVLGLDEGSSLKLQSLGASLEGNQNRVTLPISTQGRDIWSGGRDVWSGGRDVWSGGRDVWSGGVNRSYMLNNETNWQQISLFGAHNLSSNLGQGVLVAVIDTGIDLEHPLLVDNLGSSQAWYDFVDSDTYPDEEGGSDDSGYGHGTAMAGIIVQVAPRATLLPLRILDEDGQGDLSDLIRAILMAIDRGAKVINLSLGTDGESAILKLIITYAAQRGVHVVASVGNSGQNSLLYPSGFARDNRSYAKYITSVGSVDASDVKSDFSNYGAGLELVAPGEDVYTAYPNGELVHSSGTSASAAMVSGIVAMGISTASSTKKSQLEALLINSADDINQLSGNSAYIGQLGKRVDAGSFVASILP